jgi:hypothetical protein
MRVVQNIFLVVIVFALVSDVMTLVLNIKRNNQGYGTSGIPIISLLIYMIYFGYLAKAQSFKFRITCFLVLCIVHFLCQFLLPRIHLRWIGRDD